MYLLSYLCTLTLLKSFIEKAARDLQTIVHLQRTAMQDYRQVAKYFGEDPHKMRSDDFFAAFAGFITDYQVNRSFAINTYFVNSINHRSDNQTTSNHSQTVNRYTVCPLCIDCCF